MRQGQPVISVDTKKKELIGNFENKGRQWRRQGAAEKVKATIFPTRRCRAPILTASTIWPGIRALSMWEPITTRPVLPWPLFGVGGDTKAGDCIRKHNRLLITADGGGSNGYRVRLWKWELQRLADQTGLEIAVCHFPPGTSKWNKVEHRLFSFISSNWRGEPLRDYETVVGLIACTTTAKGLKVNCRLDRRRYPPDEKYTEQMASIHLKPERFHGEWNYVIYPPTQVVNVIY